ncbi:MAG TPA: 6,7-dimethyl-8-ribityllumazine synthase [Terriglobales bacterium]|nr:6,7-dimethyl-8-ribityllumazine synthase [Terriglobales bacterium]
MLKSLHIGRYVGDPNDLRVLREFLHAIGFEAVDGEDGKSAILSAPLALLSLNSLAKEYPAEVRERLKDVNRMLVIEVTNPDEVFEIAEKRKFRLLADLSSSTTPKTPTAPTTNERTFSLELPGEIVLTIHGRPEEVGASIEGQLNAAGKRFAIVVSRFNSFITERLLQGALDGLRRAGAENDDIALVRVPGSFEIPSAARTLAETKKYDAIICLGCLLRGDTPHYDVLVNEVTRGIGQSAQETGVPHAFGVLTCETLEQAIDRAGLKMGNKGLEAALAAVEMANLRKAVVGRRSLVVGKSKGVVGRSSLVDGKSKSSRRKQKR